MKIALIDVHVLHGKRHEMTSTSFSILTINQSPAE